MASEADIRLLANQFTSYMYETVRALAKLGYSATRFHQMLNAENDGPAVARRLVVADASDGLWRLKQLGRLDLSAEMAVLHPEFDELFEQSIRQHAYDKLVSMEFDVNSQLRELASGK